MCSNLAAQPSGLRQGQALNWRRKWQPIPVVLPGKSHGKRKLMGYSPRGPKRVRHDLETKQQQQGELYSKILLTGLSFG